MIFGWVAIILSTLTLILSLKIIGVRHHYKFTSDAIHE